MSTARFRPHADPGRMSPATMRRGPTPWRSVSRAGHDLRPVRLLDEPGRRALIAAGLSTGDRVAYVGKNSGTTSSCWSGRPRREVVSALDRLGGTAAPEDRLHRRRASIGPKLRLRRPEADRPCRAGGRRG
ncbi:hypothetical protein ACRAWD_06490 [Caulobacter segnis]